MTRKTWITALATVAMGLVLQTAQAASIGVNFASNVEGLESTDVTGVVTQQNWNNASGGSGTLSSGTVMDSTGGIATGVSVAWARPYGGGVANTLTSAANTATASGEMFKGVLYWYRDSDFGEIKITVAGLGSAYTTNGYDVYLYVAGDTTNKVGRARITDGAGIYNGAGTTYFKIDNTIAAYTTFTQATGTSVATANLSNYVLFSGQTSSGFTIRLNPENTSGQLGVAGIQIVPTVVPEPASLALLGLGGLCLLPRRRNA